MSLKPKAADEDLFADANDFVDENEKRDVIESKPIVDHEEDSWESATWNEEKPKESAKKRKEEKQKVKEIKDKTKAEQKQQLLATGGSAVADNKELEGMFEQAAKQAVEFNVTEEIFSIGDTSKSKFRIELLKPKTKKDFDQFAELLANKIRESEQEKKYYMSFLKDLLTEITTEMKSSEVRELHAHLSNIALKKVELEKQKAQPQGKKKAAVVLEKADVDPFGLDNYSASNSGKGNSNGDFDPDEDFM